MRWVLLVVFVVFPYSASAAVYISEVAWMGSTESANYEWIELHNDGAATAVDGWLLRDGMNLEIELTGTIPAGAYVVLERTSDASAAGSAFLIYTGALVNTGAALQLERADGSLVDQVVGGEDWQNIGGDNVTKETAQYTSAGWVTAAATPGRGITATEVAVAAAADDKKETATTKTSSGPLQPPIKKETTVLTLPDVTLRLQVVALDQGYVNQSTDFQVLPSGIGDSLIDSLQYEWNFGDGSVAVGKETAHVYAYPGKYVVTVYGGYKRQEQVARHEITILPVAISLTLNESGDVQVNNDSPYEIDLSGYRVKADREVVLPPRTILLPNQTITIPHAQLGHTEERLVGVYDAASVLVASRLPTTYEETTETLAVRDVSPTPRISATAVSRPAALEAQSFGFAAEPEVVKSAESDMVSAQVSVAGAAPLPAESRWPYVALMGTLLLGTLGVYAAPRRNESE